ncbi:MAG TPA: hypothetical protein VFB38_02275 [Chthonomonadaceae bacterium]|nr:hypothetical protein [Chthonomonadaceae bacterium]
MSNVYATWRGYGLSAEEVSSNYLTCENCGALLISDEEVEAGLCDPCLDLPLGITVTEAGHALAARTEAEARAVLEEQPLTRPLQATRPTYR